MEFIKSMLGLLLLCVAIGAIISIFIFIFDVFKWHDREVRFKVVPSSATKPVEDKSVDDSRESYHCSGGLDKKDYTESEVSNVGDDAGKYNPSTFLGSGM